MRAWLDLTRVFNVPIPLAGMLVGACAPGPANLADGATLSLCALCGCISTQAFNDYEDREVDAINAAFRPIPAGRLNPGEVLVVAHACVLAWAWIAWSHAPAAALVVGLVYLCTRWYSRFKRATLIHHLLTPAALGSMPAFGSLMVHGEVAPLAYYAGASIFLIDVNMNIVGSFKDLWAGSAHERVLPVVWGPRPAVLVALGAGLTGIGVQVVAIADGSCGRLPLVFLGLGAMLTVHSRLALLRRPSAAQGYTALKSGRLTECLTFPALLAGLLPAPTGLFIIASLTLFALVTQTLIVEAQLPDAASQPLS